MSHRGSREPIPTKGEDSSRYKEEESSASTSVHDAAAAGGTARDIMEQEGKDT